MCLLCDLQEYYVSRVMTSMDIIEELTQISRDIMAIIVAVISSFQGYYCKIASVM